MLAIKAKSAKARATIARNIYVNNKTGNFNRNLDGCFEMGDGDEVVVELIRRIDWDLPFCLAMLKHEQCGIVKVTQAIKAKYNPADLYALDHYEYSFKTITTPIIDRLQGMKTLQTMQATEDAQATDALTHRRGCLCFNCSP